MIDKINLNFERRFNKSKIKNNNKSIYASDPLNSVQKDVYKRDALSFSGSLKSAILFKMPQKRPELDKYKLSNHLKYGLTPHHEFIKTNPLFKTMNIQYKTDDNGRKVHAANGECVESWMYNNTYNLNQSAWKIHIFADKEKDWQMLVDSCGKYLQDKNINWKTLAADYPPEFFGIQSVQFGKAFTIYPRTNMEMEQIARDLDYIIRINRLCTKQSSIVGDNTMGTTGRLFYRYEYSSVKDKNTVFNLGDYNQDILFSDSYYECNSARQEYYRQHPRHDGGEYLARDMELSDDPWRNFDPANPYLKPVFEDTFGIPKAKIGETLHKNLWFKIEPNAKLLLGDDKEGCILDLSTPNRQKILASMKDGDTITIGRSSDNDIIIPSKYDYVSRVHCAITKFMDYYAIMDKSSNGTKYLSEVQDKF